MHNIIIALIILGNSRKDQDIDSAYLEYSFALKLADRFRLVRFRPQIFYETGVLHMKAGNLKMAIELFDSARCSAIRTSNDTIVCNVDIMMGTIYLDVWNQQQAKSLFERAFKLAMETHLYKQAGVALGNIAQFTGAADSSINTMKAAIRLIDKVPGPGKEKGMIFINIGNRMLNPDSAIWYYQKAICSGNGNPIPDIVMQSCNNMAYSLLDKQQATKAGELLQFTAIPIAAADSNFDWLATLYDTWADVKIYQRDYKEALALEKKAIKTRIIAESRKSVIQVRLLLMLLDVRKKDLLFDQAQLRVTSQQDDILSLKFIVFSLVIVLLLIGVALIGVFQGIKIKSQRKELELTKRKVDIHDYERKQLAMQLHDLTGPFDRQIARRINNLSFTDPLMREEMIAEWKKVSSTIHSVSYQLNNKMVEDLPFPELINSLVEEFRLMTDLVIDFEIVKGTVISQGQHVNMFCIIQELLTNAMKYVKTGLVNIKLTAENETLYLFYHDAGPGFDVEKQKKEGMGINNIFERAMLLGGKTTLRSSAEKGTSWSITIPNKDHE